MSKSKSLLQPKLSNALTVVMTVAVVMLVAVAFVLVLRSHAAGDTLTLSPSVSTVTPGSTFKVVVDENSNSDAINAVEADLTYDQTKLQLMSIDTSTSAFSLEAANTGASGVIKLARASSTAVTGIQPVATLTFQAIGTGSTSVSYTKSTSALVRASDGVNVLSSVINGAYSIGKGAR